MSAIERITKAAHLIDMNDIIREGNPTLRAIAEEVTFPLSDQEIILGEKMMQFLKHSQDPVMAEKMGLRGGVGLAAPQLDISKRIIAVLVPNIVEEGETPQEAYDLEAIMYNPKIVSHSVQDAALGEGEGCLSVDRNVPGYVVRHARVTVDYFDKDGENTVSNSKATTPLLFSMKLTTLTVSCFTIASMKKTHLQLKMVY
ncbi:peptide deformylase 2 [Streptococcus pneumoniae 2090008]|nr:peptide deformylase 2 [Streptococcus pneumoniae 2090008]